MGDWGFPQQARLACDKRYACRGSSFLEFALFIYFSVMLPEGSSLSNLGVVDDTQWRGGFSFGCRVGHPKENFPFLMSDSSASFFSDCLVKFDSKMLPDRYQGAKRRRTRRLDFLPPKGGQNQGVETGALWRLGAAALRSGRNGAVSSVRHSVAECNGMRVLG